MTIQDLKNHREEIIAFANDKGLDLKKFMNHLVEAVNFGLNETEDVMEFVYHTWDYTFATRSRKVPKYAEIIGSMEIEGKIKTFNMNNYYANKNTRG